MNDERQAPSIRAALRELRADLEDMDSLTLHDWWVIQVGTSRVVCRPGSAEQNGWILTDPYCARYTIERADGSASRSRRLFPRN